MDMVVCTCFNVAYNDTHRARDVWNCHPTPAPLPARTSMIPIKVHKANIAWSTSHNINDKNQHNCIEHKDNRIKSHLCLAARVSPYPQEHMKLLTHGGNEHHHSGMNGG